MPRWPSSSPGFSTATNLNVDQFKGMNIFSDVPSWAEGFVNLCASLDIVAGVGGDKFDPNATVTTARPP